MSNMNNTNSESSRPPFVLQSAYIETPFEKRYLAIMQRAWQDRSWYVISAVPGSGKSVGIKELQRKSGAYKDRTGITFMPVLAIRAPKDKAEASVLGGALALALGVSPSKWSWNRLRNELVPALDYFQVECIIIDDAHDLNMSTLSYIKELTDNLEALPYERRVGLCLVTAHSNNLIPLKEIILQPDEIWKQFYRRMDKVSPFCVVDGHTQDEVLAILWHFEQLYQSQLPDLRLRRWASYIYKQLTNQILDLDSSRRVTMDNLTKFVTIAVGRAYNRGETDVTPQILAETAEQMIQHRDDIFHINGDSTIFHVGGDLVDEKKSSEQETG
jgi:AAA domain-containing protein